MGGDQPFIGMIIVVPYNFAPVGWVFCQGQLMPISENDALFTLLGTTYGGDGQTTFGMPNMQSRVALHNGNGTFQGQTGGVESVTLTTNQIPIHNHIGIGSSVVQNSTVPGGNVVATGPTTYKQLAPDGGYMPANTLTMVGGNQPHDNRQPYLALNFIISLYGIFPSQN